MDEAHWRAELEAARAEKEAYFREEFVQMMGAAGDTFAGLEFYPPDPAYRVKAQVEPGDQTILHLATSTGVERPMRRYARLIFTVDGVEQHLTAFRGVAAGPGDELFIPFRDATSGHETYGAGRYLDPPLAEGAASLLLDFNDAYNPLCAYSPHYSCPYPPPENHLRVPIRAGERYSSEH